MEYFRIDDAYEKVYSYDEESKSYVFYATFYALGINKEMSHEKQMQVVYADFYNNYEY